MTVGYISHTELPFANVCGNGKKQIALIIMDRYYKISSLCLTYDVWSVKRHLKVHKETVKHIYRKTSNISRTLVGNKIVDNSDVVGASPVGAAPTTSSFST